MEPLDPDALEGMRRAQVSSDFLYKVGIFVAVVVLYLNLMGGLGLVVVSQAWPHLLWGAGVAWGIAVVLPAVFMVGIWLLMSKPIRVCRGALCQLFDVPTPGWGKLVVLWMLIVGVVGLFSWVAAMVGSRMLFTAILALMSLLIPLSRRRFDPGAPRWALVFTGSWMLLMAAVFWGVAPSLSEDSHSLLFAGLVLFAPFILPMLVFRGRIKQSALARGRLAKLVVFLPPLDQAAVEVGLGEPKSAMERLTRMLPRLRNRRFLELYSEGMYDALHALNDPRAVQMLVLIAPVVLTSPGVFKRLAENDLDPERALGFALFAEANAVRRGRVDVAPYTVLRERLEGAIGRPQG